MFWRRGEDARLERSLSAQRAEPREEFVSSILRRLTTASAPEQRTAHSTRRIGLALTVTVTSLALAAMLGGVSGASAGIGGIFRVAANVVSPTHHSHRATNDKNRTGDGKSSAHDQYAVGVCHKTGNGKYILLYVPPSSVTAHLRHGDKLAVAGHC